jgi:threonine dehydrogenase-like Zn-dependent dehydrogenase
MRAGGDINIFGMGLDQEPIPVDFNRIYKSELTLRSSYSATPDTLSRAFDLIVKEGKIDVSGLVSEVFPLSDFKKGLDLMLEKKIYKALYKL